MTSTASDLDAHNRLARQQALAALGTAAVFESATVSFTSRGRAVILGPEHRIRQVAAPWTAGSRPAAS